MEEPRRELLVALGDDGGLGAVDWAVARAWRTGLSLRLVHVVHPPRGLARPENILLTFDTAELVGRELVSAALERVQDLAGGEITVRTAAPTGHAVEVLTSLAAGCIAVVAQHRAHGWAGHMFGGSVTAGVAVRVDVPVVSVPHTWDAASDARVRGGGAIAPRVTVGVARSEEADDLVAHALDTAALEPNSCLTILHAWHVPAAYELGLMPPDFEVGWVERETRALTDLAEAWQEELPPGVGVETRLVHAHPVTALVEASRNSDHLVLGRSHAHPPRHVGSVSAALLRHSTCPVELVPPTARGHARPAG